MAPKSIRLSIDEALAAVRGDLRQYEPQLLLICGILRVLPNGPGVIQRKVGADGVWVRKAGGTKMRWLEGEDLVDFTCDTLTAAGLGAQDLASICRRVFRTGAKPEVDPATGLTGIRIDIDMEAFSCRQCGACCRGLDYRHELTEADVQRWREEKRDDILAWVGTATNPEGGKRYRMWVTPGTCRAAAVCPFLAKVPDKNRWKCLIQDSKPQICRSYPMSRKHALMTGCPGFNKKPGR